MQVNPSKPLSLPNPEPTQAKPTETREETASTKVTPSENKELKAAAERSGKSLAEWLRDVALREARKDPPIGLELILEELCALRIENRNCMSVQAKASQKKEFIQEKTLNEIHEFAETKKVQKAEQVAKQWRMRQADGAVKG